MELQNYCDICNFSKDLSFDLVIDFSFSTFKARHFFSFSHSSFPEKMISAAVIRQWRATSNSYQIKLFSVHRNIVFLMPIGD